MGLLIFKFVHVATYVLLSDESLPHDFLVTPLYYDKFIITQVPGF